MLTLSAQRYQYEELGNNRSLACVRVMAPENPMHGMWQLYWTIKREKDANGRKSPLPQRLIFFSKEPVNDKRLGQFHSQITIDPINNTSHLELGNDRKSTSHFIDSKA